MIVFVLPLPLEVYHFTPVIAKANKRTSSSGAVFASDARFHGLGASSKITEEGHPGSGNRQVLTAFRDRRITIKRMKTKTPCWSCERGSK
jgi:hypothetical protein